MSIVTGGSLSLLSGMMQGAFPLPMKYAKKWKWENIWSVFAIWGFAVFPWLWAFMTVPNLMSVYASASGEAIAAMTFFGLAWGVGTMCYGIGVSMVGIALGSAIVMGMAGAAGTLIPMMVFHADAFRTSGGLAITGGVALMLVGIAVCALAGSRREKTLQTASNQAHTPVKGKSFGKGLLVCMISGMTSPSLNFAFSFGDEIVSQAKAAGASPAHASNPIWCWVMTSALVGTLTYCIYLMSKDRGWRRYALKETGFYWGLTCLMGLLWAGSIAVYGMALSQLGPLAASIGWPILMISAIITANICGIVTGEWKDVGRKPLMTLVAGLAILTMAICLIGVGNGL